MNKKLKSGISLCIVFMSCMASNLCAMFLPGNRNIGSCRIEKLGIRCYMKEYDMNENQYSARPIGLSYVSGFHSSITVSPIPPNIFQS